MQQKDELFDRTYLNQLSLKAKQTTAGLDAQGAKNMGWPDIAKLVVSVVICEAAGGIGAIFTTPAIETWYANLKKPSVTPPNSVFGPIWITLYLLMGIAVFMVWRQGFDREDVTLAFVIFWIQLVINVLWSLVFFGRKSLLGGMILIFVLWVLILALIFAFLRVSAVAGGLLIPYIIWVTVAANLNVQIWRLNR